MSTVERPAAVHSVTWEGDVPRFHCDGDAHSRCRFFPDCDCEYYDEGHDSRHPSVEHPEECWEIGWLEAAGIGGFFAADMEVDGHEVEVNGEDSPGDVPRRDGVVETEWEGEYMLWCYAEAGG